MKLLRKEGKLSQRAGRIVDEEGRSCCCGGILPRAYLYAECCNGEPRIWFDWDRRQPGDPSPECEIIKYQGKCYSWIGQSRTLEDLDSEGIPYVSAEQFDEGEGCVPLPFPGGQYSCLYSRQFGFCPTCPDRCCTTSQITDCSTDPESIKTCTLGNGFRIRSTYRDSLIRYGWSQVRSTYIYDIVRPNPADPPYTKCIGLYNDIFYLVIIETELDATYLNEPDPLFPDIPGACRGTWTIHRARATRRIFLPSGQFLIYTNTLVQDGVDTGLPTSTSQLQYMNRSDTDEREEFAYNTIQEIEQSPFAQYFVYGPTGVCTTLQDTDGDPRQTCCNGSSRFIVDLPAYRSDKQTVIRNQNSCLSGTFSLLEIDRIRDCVSDLDPEPTLERREERERAGSYSIEETSIQTQHCDQPIDGPPFNGIDPNPLTFRGTIPTSPSSTFDLRQIGSKVRSGCASCRTSIGI